MNINVGGWDRVVRVLMGIMLITVSLMIFRPLVWLLGMALLYTGLYRSCPLYRLVGYTSVVHPRVPDSRRGLFRRTSIHW
ncbi:MAG: DUF2892 domain-containing protein [Magnetococcales bacterium]|nr:DUF2892 domain-containing protein [Magnetococcales bacterium]